jgi:hypothetical protein
MEIERLIGAGEIAPALAELLSAQLISYPDPEMGGRLLGAVARHPLALSADNYPVYAGLVCLAGVDQDAAGLKQLTTTLGKISGRPFGLQMGAAEIFLDRTPHRPISPALVALQPLSLEIMFAVLAHYPPAPANQPKSQSAR